jgi:acyl dehydratase
MTGWYLEDFEIGRNIKTEPVRLEAEEIMWFARQYDPQPFHTDRETAKDTVFEGLIASGFQTVAAATGQFIRTGVVDGTGLGGPGMENIRWVAPVRPGNTLSTGIEVTEARASKSDPSRGIVRLAFTVSNDAGVVATFDTIVMVRTREGAGA